MARNIAVADDVYHKLLTHKREDESFSEEITRMIGKCGHIMDLAGSWSMEPAESAEIKRRLKNLRSLTTRKVLGRVK